MTDFDPSSRSLGEEGDALYAVLPNPSKLYLARSKRLRSLAPGHMLESYLSFAADVTEAQHEVQRGLPNRPFRRSIRCVRRLRTTCLQSA